MIIIIIMIIILRLPLHAPAALVMVLPGLRTLGCASTILQRVPSFQLRASLFGRFNIDSINIDINTTIDADGKTNHFLQP